MRRPSLLRRREVWVPTVWGWLAILLVGAATVVLTCRHLGAFLATNQPVGARVLVVEGWMDPEDMDQAVTAFRSGGYERVVTTGGPIHGWSELHVQSTFAEFAADYLKKHGLADVPVVAVPAPDSAQNRTFLNGVVVRDWALKSGLGLDAVDVFSAGVHARRSRLLYAMALGPKFRVGVLAARPNDYDVDHWWRTSVGTKDVISETLGLAWTKCFFWPGPPGSPEERWVVLRSRPAPSTDR